MAGKNKKDTRKHHGGTGGRRKKLTNQQAMLLMYYSTSGNQVKSSAEKAGVNIHTASDWINLPLFQEELKKIQVSIRKKTEHTQEDSVREADEAAIFAMITGNANALVKARELKSKLHGFLIEKHDHRMQSPFTIEISGVRPKQELLRNVTPGELSKADLDIL